MWNIYGQYQYLRRKSYQRTYIEYIRSKFDQVIPVVSHIEKTITPINIGEAIKGPHKQIWKEALFVKYEKNKYSNFFQLPYQSNTSLTEKSSFVQLFLQVSSNATVPMHGYLLYATVKMGVILFKLLILISITFQWHMLKT